jgi:hypothetical protein
MENEDTSRNIIRNAFKDLISSILDVTDKIADPVKKTNKIMEIIKLLRIPSSS